MARISQLVRKPRVRQIERNPVPALQGKPFTYACINRLVACAKTSIGSDAIFLNDSP